MGKVYIAKGGHLYKFGNSENPDERLKQLQTGSPVPLELVYTFDAKTPKRAESTLKQMFAAKHSHGEWFKLTEADILEVKQATSDDGPAPTSIAPQQPSGAATGALKALHDIWAYRYYLLLLFILGIPLLLWMEMRNDLISGYQDTGMTVPSSYAVQFAEPSSSPAAPTELLVPGLDQVAPMPVAIPPVVEPTASQLTPINDETAYALGAIPPTAALPSEPPPPQLPPPTPTLHRRPIMIPVQKP